MMKVLSKGMRLFDIGEYGSLMYDDVSYPTDLTSIVDSTTIYPKAIDEGMDDEANYVNMYLGDTIDYGYVWRIEEHDKEEMDEYGIGVLINVYVFDLSGNLKIVTQEEVY